MINQHPITPPPELVHQWADMLSSRSDHAVFSLAAQWGADQELEACCSEVAWLASTSTARKIRDIRRLKPPSLKEQAQAELDRLIALIPAEGAMAMAEPIRRALEALPE